MPKALKVCHQSNPNQCILDDDIGRGELQLTSGLFECWWTRCCGALEKEPGKSLPHTFSFGVADMARDQQETTKQC